MIRIPKTILMKDFNYKGRRCIVFKILHYNSYCCGYIELRENEIKEDYMDYEIRSDEITYQGDLTDLQPPATGEVADGKFYMGFDSAHLWNERKPESKTPEYVAQTCKNIVDELESTKKE